ncbi:hypothetical protein [Paraburkholderia dokdonensis]|uniref:hypothetical protein n=1 Tax=Paraburkholderia dokdonensis TaxID=2211211 RepID=UPI00101A4C26|nr:hypothetical protein [Paraburkholderia dokdonensis]
MSERINASEFARREGCDEKQVRRGIERGALVRGNDGLIDAAQIGTAWRKPNRRTLQKAAEGAHTTVATETHPIKDETPKEAASRILDASPDLMPLAEALRVKENYLALLRQLEYEQKAGHLIELSLAQDVVFELIRAQRDSWLAWPVKIAPAIAAELGVDLDHLAALLAEAVYQQLLELSEARADFSGDA